MSAPTRVPVTTSGWYEDTDGRVVEYLWVQGSLVRGREAASWADVPSEPSWHAPLPTPREVGT